MGRRVAGGIWGREKGNEEMGEEKNGELNGK